MSALPDAARRDGRDRSATARLRLRAMRLADLDAVVRIEQAAYAHPWSRGNFIDTLAAGYPAQVLHGAHEIVGYFIAMVGVEELHLLNLAVAPAWQAMGCGCRLLDALDPLCRSVGAAQVWLEVRESNVRAQRIYGLAGFRQISIRRNYYPASDGRREHAVVMQRRVDDAIGDVGPR